MKSIRLSLLVYLLVLMALALGGFSFYIYENSRSRLEHIYNSTHRTLSDKNRRTQALLQEQFNRTELYRKAGFDQTLLDKAHKLADQLARAGSRRRYVQYATVGMNLALGAPAGFGSFASPLVACEAPYRRSMWRMWSQVSPELQFIETQRPLSREDHGAEFFQVSSEQGQRLIASPSLGRDLLPVECPKQNLKPWDHEFDDVAAVDGRKLRVVTVKAPVVARSWPYREPRRGGSGFSPVRTGIFIPGDPEDDPFAPVVFIQYARPSKEVDDMMAELRADLTGTQQNLDRDLSETLQNLEADSRSSLANLRTKLLLISLATFLAAAVGGIWLVHKGLSPIHGIAQAVSQVSERNFGLRLKQGEVPTELQPIVEKLEEVLSSLGRAFAHEKQAAADISHDLRTPIAALLATTQVSLRKARTPEEYRSALATCQEIGQQLNTLVERLLMLARLDAGADQLRPDLVDVPEVAAQCVSMVRPLAEQKGLQLRLDRNGPVLIETDPDKLREVLTNLLHNAIQYNRPDGTVALSVNRENGHVKLEVSDTGIGIPADARKHLFERFYRADPSRQADAMHSGLGLAIVKGYVDLMGGRIEVDSAEGQGSTFRVLLPALPDDES